MCNACEDVSSISESHTERWSTVSYISRVSSMPVVSTHARDEVIRLECTTMF